MLAVAAVALSSCSYLPRYYVIPRDTPPPLVVGEEVDGKKLTLARTQQLFVQLPLDASAGFQWRAELDNDLSLFPSGAAPRVLAAVNPSAATTEFRFRGDGVGSTKVRMSYVPSTNMLAQPSKLIAFEVETR